MAGNGRCLIQTGATDDDIISELYNLDRGFSDLVSEIDPPLGITIPMLVRYMVFAYDKNSHIAIEFKSRWIQKKKESAIRAGFPTINDGNLLKFTVESESIIFNKNPQFSDLIMLYLFIQWDSDWLMHSVYNEMYYNVMKDLQKYNYDKPSDLQKAKQNAEDIREDIDKLNYKIFSGMEDRTLVNLLYEDSYRKSLDLRPEQLITKKERGEPVVDITPYGSNYEIPVLKFIGDQ
jgi:hypothetical protein